MSEILAPSGDKKSALAAINAGANAIYLGLKQFSARNSAENFVWEDFISIVKTAHAFDVKVYVAMNIMIKDGEIEEFLNFAVKAWNCGADALIISDIFVGKFIKETYPEITLHLSTQAGVCNVYGAELAKEFGFSRVILARETAFEDIVKIAKIIETEVFVQGALCTCFSGQCYFSSFVGGNSGNRGRCKQPCRKCYSLDRVGYEKSAYRLSLADLSVGEDINKLVDAGVCSFKIEGRMRRAEYVSAAVKYYVDILNNVNTNTDCSDLKRTFNRGNYTKGLMFGQDKSFISSAVQGHIGEFVGLVKVENGKYVVKTSQKFAEGDCFKILRDGKEAGGATYSCGCKSGFVLSSRVRLKNGDKVFVTTDTTVNSRLSAIKRNIVIEISATFTVGHRAEVCVNGHYFYGENVLEKAEKRPLTVDEIKNCFKKTDKFPFEVQFKNITTDGVFIAASELNKLRRDAYNGYFDLISVNKNTKIGNYFKIPELIKGNNEKIAVISTDLKGLSADVGILKTDDFTNIEELMQGFTGEKYLYLPPYLSGEEIENIKPGIKQFDGIYCDGLYGIKLADEVGKSFFAGTGFNLSNKIAVSLCKAKYVALSKELTKVETNNLLTENSFCLVAGGIKLMDLVYCPFEKSCKTCDMRKFYTLTDEGGRKFPIYRYKFLKQCRFEVYNCVNLVTEKHYGGKLLDCTVEENADIILKNFNNAEKLKQYYGGKYTYGHSVKPVE